MEKLSRTDSQPQSPENIQIEIRESVCVECGSPIREEWQSAGKTEYVFMGKTRCIQDPAQCVEKKNYDGRCVKCWSVRRDAVLAERERLAREKREQEGIAAIGGPKAYFNFRLEKYVPINPSQKEALRLCEEFNPGTDNLLLVGPTGTGKTHLACGIALREFSPPFKRFRVTELLRILRFERKAREEEQFIKEIVESPIFILEDLGAHKETDWGSAVLWEIIDRRIEAERHGLIVTSNFGRGKMAEQMGDKIPSRLSAICKVVTVDGDDYRIKNPTLKLVFDEPIS